MRRNISRSRVVKPLRAALEHSQASPTFPSFRQILSQSDERSSAAVGANDRPRLLIVEDDLLVAWQMEEALTDAGFTVTGVASSLEDALQFAETTRPELVLMDIRLYGDRDGVEAALELFHKHALRCLFTSAHTDYAVRKRAEPAQPVGWLPKPYTMSALVYAVREGLKALRG
jgi:DNA-binding response OmpR family regulator